MEHKLVITILMTSAKKDVKECQFFSKTRVFFEHWLLSNQNEFYCSVYRLWKKEGCCLHNF